MDREEYEIGLRDFLERIAAAEDDDDVAVVDELRERYDELLEEYLESFRVG